VYWVLELVLGGVGAVSDRALCIWRGMVDLQNLWR